jgi:hypothetical protein
MTVIQSNITSYSIPVLPSSGISEIGQNTIAINFVQQHYIDHQTFGSIINSLNNSLKVSNPTYYYSAYSTLTFNDKDTFNVFLEANEEEHSLFYKSSNNIAELLVKQGYGIQPTVLNFWQNPMLKVDKFDFNTLNQFMYTEYQIHLQLTRYFNILLATFSNQPIPKAGVG